MKATTKSYLFIGSVFVAAMLIISIFLPREKAINIEFTLGQPWTHEQLTATFDFAVEKSESTLERERAEIMASQRPYFVMDQQVGTAMRDSFNTFYHRDLYLLMRTSLRQKIEQRLQEVYAHGIIATNDLERLRNDSIGNIMLIGEANIATLKRVDELYTVQQAYESLMAIDTTAWGRYTLQSCNLNNFIHPNIAYDKERSEAVLREALASISPNSGVILAGQKIIGSGEMVDEALYQALHSYQKDLKALR